MKYINLITILKNTEFLFKMNTHIYTKIIGLIRNLMKFKY